MDSQGFTLIEMVIVIALLAAIVALGLFVSFDQYHGSSFHSERDVIVGTLQKARSQAISNMCFGKHCAHGMPHGVYFGDHNHYVIFEGESWTSRDSTADEIIDAEYSVERSGVSEVVFQEIAGAAIPAPSAIILTDSSGRTSDISIDTNGRISWTN